MQPQTHTLEQELNKRLKYPYKWGRKQNNSFDKATNFIYRTFDFDQLLFEVKERFGKLPDHDEYFNYTINRWYNFWSSDILEKIFCQSQKVQPAQNSKDKYVDFYIENIPFDLKISRFPQKYPRSPKFAVYNKKDLIRWLYKHQSKQQREHYHNRLFLVIYSKNGNHWKLRAEISWLREIIDEYLEYYHRKNLSIFPAKDGKQILSDIIWAIK